MEKILKAALLTAAVVGLMVPCRVFAQTDTLKLAANPIPGSGPTIDQQIMNDTTSNGQQRHIYLLQQTGPVDSVYFIGSSIYSSSNLTIVGKPNPVTGALPIVAPILNANNSSPSELFVPQKGNVTLKNLYLMFTNTNGTAISGNGINVIGDSVSITLDHCVLDGTGKSNAVYLSGNWDNLFASNCEFRNSQYVSANRGGCSWASGRVPADSVIIKNCTFFCENGNVGFGGPGYHKFVEYEHNTVFGSAGEAMQSRAITDAVIKDNIFYDVSNYGADTSSYTHQSHEGSYIGNQVFGFDSLAATTAYTDFGYTEAQRHIIIEHNVYFWPKAMTALFDTLKSDTGSTITHPVWMDQFVDSMFTDKSIWPNDTALYNGEIDPGFNSAYVTEMVDSLIPFVKDYWETGSSSHLWGIYMDNPNNVYILPSHTLPVNWSSTQGYPVPENLAYSNDSLQSAGTRKFALGDLNWYPAQLKLYEEGGLDGINSTGSQLPEKFELSQNYPNPFNPSTTIKVDLSSPGVMSLKIYNVLGQLVDVVTSGYRQAGKYLYQVDMDRFASGVYFYTLRQGTNSITKKMLLLK